jgi:hypothetical protein
MLEHDDKGTKYVDSIASILEVLFVPDIESFGYDQHCAREAIHDFVVKKMKEDGVMAQVMPPTPIPSTEEIPGVPGIDDFPFKCEVTS